MALFAVVTWQVSADGPMRRADERLGRAIGTSAFPTPLAGFFSDLGAVYVALPVLAAVAAFTAWHARRAHAPRWWLPPLTALLALALVPALVAPLKALIDRPGPASMGGAPGFYPSGHTATATVAFGACALLLLPLLRRTGARVALIAACVLLNAAVGHGLVRRGYHWPLDVVGSWCLGLLLLLGAVAVTRWGVSRSRRRSSSSTPSC